MSFPPGWHGVCFLARSSHTLQYGAMLLHLRGHWFSIKKVIKSNHIDCDPLLNP